MSRDVAQGLLQHPVDVNSGSTVDRYRRALALVRHGDAQLALNRRQIPVDRALEAHLLEDAWMQRLRQAPHLREHRLRDLGGLPKLAPDGRILRQVLPRALEHRADGRECLTEFVMQLA